MDILITVLIIMTVFLGFRYLMQKRASRAKGKEVDASIFNDDVKDLLTKEKSILYFFTPTCGACKTQTPIIDEIDSKTNSVGKIDLSIKKMSAREFGIMGTPSIALMKGNKIADIFVGIKQKNFILKKFNQI